MKPTEATSPHRRRHLFIEASTIDPLYTYRLQSKHKFILKKILFDGGQYRRHADCAGPSMMRKRRFCETLGVRRKIPSEYQRFWGHCRMRTACRKRSDAMAEARRMAICYLHVARRIYRAKSVGKSRALGRRRSSSTLPESRDRDENAKVTRLFEPFRTFRICHRQGNSIHILSPFFSSNVYIPDISITQLLLLSYLMPRGKTR